MLREPVLVRNSPVVASLQLKRGTVIAHTGKTVSPGTLYGLEPPPVRVNDSSLNAPGSIYATCAVKVGS